MKVEKGFTVTCFVCKFELSGASKQELNKIGWEPRKDGWICPVCLEDEIMGGEKGV